jgi:four helix bundle protein
MTDYKDLIIWQKSRLLVRTVYILTRKLPKEELFGLTNQVRRAVVSIPSNIAEGFNRGSDKEFIHFLRIAKGSAAEVETQLILCVDLGYLDSDDIVEAIKLYNEILRMLGTLIVRIEQRVNKKK